MENVDKELLPCAFCGTEAHILQTSGGGFEVECMNPRCAVFMPVESGEYFTSKHNAMYAWNERKPTAPELKPILKENRNKIAEGLQKIVALNGGEYFSMADWIIDNFGTPIKAAEAQGMQTLDEEKNIRIKYQNIVYKICALFDETKFNSEGRSSVERCTIETVIDKVKALKFSIPSREVASVEKIKETIKTHGGDHLEEWLLNCFAMSIYALLTNASGEKWKNNG